MLNLSFCRQRVVAVEEQAPVSGVTLADGNDGAPAPTAFHATTVKV